MIANELLVSVEFLSGVRQHLYYHCRVEQNILPLVEESHFPAHNKQIGIREEALCAEPASGKWSAPNLHILGKRGARRPEEVCADDSNEVDGYDAVRWTLAGHRIDDTFNVFMTLVCLTFLREKFVLRVRSFGFEMSTYHSKRQQSIST